MKKRFNSTNLPIKAVTNPTQQMNMHVSWSQWTWALAWLFLGMLLSAHAIEATSCMLNDAELMKQRRINTLKNSILAQLGVSEPQQGTASETLPGEEAMKATFNALRSASASLEREKERRCHSEDFYAKPVSSFIGVMSEGEII